MSVPATLRKQIKDRLWSEADRLNWPSLTASDKSRYYTIWTETADVGGQLARYMDPRKVRVYIKDTLLKPYARESSSDPSRVLRVLNVSGDLSIVEKFIKPHGCRLSDGRCIAWSRASDWKLTLLAVYERAFSEGEAHAVVLTECGGKFEFPEQRTLVSTAAERLGIKRLLWLE